ncbi:type II toxin-antitoxin system CcdA family antitoxin [Siccibacter turicensis]|uniref:type II toxin-antitoxin system CcdA family antitoxin n=1 Tax=Siccibacter turicensis TaxID=357233 RepID=UPI00046713CE|nr:type II toxin-antitoxin system CcdA family antitoxin [Siccibacter turicensis]MDY0972139.1 type II toxin-antitoxin system CcdA family antitoxin [Siccibacter turicensis]
MSAMLKQPKRTVSVTVDEALYQRAKAHGINLSQRLGEALEKELSAVEQVQWKEANRDGLEEINRITDACGHFSDQHHALAYADQSRNRFSV